MPLTTSQKEKLEKIIAEQKYPPKYLKLLSHSIQGWEKSIPTMCRFGIVPFENIYFSDSGGCCLLGSALIGKRRQIDYNRSLFAYFNIDDMERCSIIDGFDGDINIHRNHIVYEFG